MEALADITADSTINAWDMPETPHVLHAHGNTSVIDNIYDRISLLDILAVCTTSRAGWVCWLRSRGRWFHMDKMTAVYLNDVEAFRSILQYTGSVVAGSCVESFLNRRLSGKQPMDVVVEFIHAQAIQTFLIEKEGYARWAGDRWTQEEYFARRRSKRRTQGKGLVPDRLRKEHEDPFEATFTYMRRLSVNKTQYIRINIPSTCVAKSILTPDSSKRHFNKLSIRTYSPTASFMAFMSAQTLMALCPKATYIHNVSIRLNSSKSGRGHPSPVFTEVWHDNILHRPACTARDKRMLNNGNGKGVLRSMGDKASWTMFYNERGEVTTQDEEKKADQMKRLGVNKWSTNIVEGMAQVDVYQTDWDSFRP
ncbi:hypothetical protein HWV62_24452 [Athelia sp. TMB]|nr:hypothetical protein HWV62_24452 [Athelia sp. TMB]